LGGQIANCVIGQIITTSLCLEDTEEGGEFDFLEDGDDQWDQFANSEQVTETSFDSLVRGGRRRRRREEEESVGVVVVVLPV